MEENMKKKIIIGIIMILAIGIAFGVKYAIDFSYYEKTMPTVSVQDIDFKEIKDGVYEGSFDARIISATAQVTVSEGKVTKIELLKHKYEKGGAAVAIIDEVIKKQSLKVDVVSGATESSKTILKSIENALNGNAE
jgi:uncharacterized protein with FMN-binding domain